MSRRNDAPARILLLAVLLAGSPALAQEPPEHGAAWEDAQERAEEERRVRKEKDHGFRHMLDVLELVDAPVFDRNMLQTKYEWTQKAAGASMGELTFKPVFTFGEEREFALRIEAPLETFWPSGGGSSVSGFASLTTTLMWGFFSVSGIRQAVGLELQWNTASNPAVGQPWIIEPVYVVAFKLWSTVALSVEVNWQKSFGNLGTYKPVNTIQFKPTVTVGLPAWFYVAVQDKTSWSIQDQNVGSLLKITAGRFLTRNKTVVLAVEYETSLDPVAAEGTVFMVGGLLTYFFTW
jgi:hypothetical protein